MPRRHASLGVALIVGAAACFASMDTTTRYLGVALPVLLMLWARYTFQAAVMAVWLLSSRRSGFGTAHPRFQAVRGLLLLATSALAFYGLQLMPVPEFTAVTLITPMLVTLLAAWLLHERVSPLRWALVGGGLAGALIVIRPGSGLFGWAVAFPLAGALTYASFQVLTSRLAAHESPYTTHFYTGAVGALILTPVILASSIDIEATLRHAQPMQLALLVAIGCFGTLGHLLLVLAFGRASTATLMPFMYTQIAWAAVLGWLVFRRLPDGWAWVGMAVVAACGAASAWLNVRDAASKRVESAVAADTVVD